MPASMSSSHPLATWPAEVTFKTEGVARERLPQEKVQQLPSKIYVLPIDLVKHLCNSGWLMN